MLALSKDLTKNDPRALRNMRFRRNANPEIFDLCRKILVEEADKRIKFESIKYHPFFNRITVTRHVLQSGVFVKETRNKRLSHYSTAHLT